MTKRCDHCHSILPEYGGIVADADRGEVRFRDKRCGTLTTQEFALFQYLLDRAGRVASKEDILARLYGLRPEDPPEIKIVDVFICKLRKKVAPMGLSIGTTWGRGYYLEEPRP